MDTIFFVSGVALWILVSLVVVGRSIRWLGSLGRLEARDRWIVVTGCDSGFGLGVVEALVARGARVMAYCYTEAGEARAKAAGAAATSRLDLTDGEARRVSVERVEALTGGQLWGVVHNAGRVDPGFVEYLSLDRYRAVMELNFFAIVDLTRRLVPPLAAAKGRVVLISSVDGIVSLPGNAPYDASKFALEAYADALRLELGFRDIKVAVVNPSTMRTPLALGFFEGHRAAWAEMAEREPTGPWRELYTPQWLDEYVEVNTVNLERIAQDPKHTVEDIVHALTAKRPRLRYLSGFAAKTLFRALWLMPERWSHAIKLGLIQPPPR